MASLALGAVGAGIGGLFGQVAGAELGFSIGITLGGLLFPPKQGHQAAGRLKDLRVTGSGYGAVIPQMFGSMRLGGNIIWSTDLVEHSAGRSGGKGTRASKERKVSYSVSIAYGVCRGPIGRIKRIWAEDIVIYDDSDTPASKYNVTIHLGDETQLPDNTIKNVEGVANTPAFRGMCYVVLTDWDLSTWGNRIPSMSFEVAPALSTNYTVGQILADLFAQAGLTTGQYNVTDATDVVTGLTITGREAVRDSIQDLLRIYNTDLIEIDGKITAKKRGTAPLVTIPAADMGSRLYQEGGGNPEQNIVTKRKQDLELPFRLDLQYFSPVSDYQQAAQGATRYAKVNLQDATTVSTQLTLNDSEARQAAEKILHQMWIEREEFSLVVPIKYIYLCPGDVINVTVGSTDSILRARIISMDIALFGPIQLSCVLDDISVLSQSVSGAAIQTTTALKESITTAVVAWSGNAVRDADASTFGYYVSLGGTSTWPGAQLYWSRDSGSSYQILDTITDSGVFGTATSVLAPGYDDDWDTVNTVDITLTAGTGTPPVSTSDADVISGSNAAIIGNEIIQFATVTPLGGNSYRLSRLLRGRRGTDGHWNEHVSGEQFLLLEVGRVHRYTVGDDLKGRTIYLKAISTNQALGDVSPTLVVVTGDEWKTYAPVQPSEVVSP